MLLIISMLKHVTNVNFVYSRASFDVMARKKVHLFVKMQRICF